MSPFTPMPDLPHTLTVQLTGLAFVIVGLVLLYACRKLKVAHVDEAVWRPIGFAMSFMFAIMLFSIGGGMLFS